MASATLKLTPWYLRIFFAKGPPPVRIAHSQVQGPPDPQTPGSRCQPFRDHHLVKAERTPVQFTHQVFLGHLHVPENQPPGATPPAAHEAVQVFRFHAGPLFHDKKADAAVFVGIGLKIGFAVNQEKISPFGAHDKPFHAVQNEVVPVAFRPGHGTEKIRPAPGLGESLGCHQFPFDIGFQIFLLLLFGAEHVQGLAHDGGHDKGAPQGHAQAADFFGGGHIRHPAHPPTPVLLGEADAPQTFGGQFLHELPRVGDLVIVHLAQKVTGDLVTDKPAHFLLQLLFFRCEQKIVHTASFQFELAPRQNARFAFKLWFNIHSNCSINSGNGKLAILQNDISCG
jgi:hypothetical protein